MKQPQMYKAPKCSTGKCMDRKAPQKKKELPKDLDFSKMKRAGNANERASVDQQARKKGY
jgi:hypothetical protein